MMVLPPISLPFRRSLLWQTSVAVDSLTPKEIAMLRVQAPFRACAIAKAESAYPVISPLQQALSYFQTHSDFRDRCFEQLQIQQRDNILSEIERLAIDQQTSD